MGVGALNTTLRAMGIVEGPACVTVSGFYVIGLPVGLALAFAAGAGVSGLWLGLLAASVYVTLALGCIFRGIDWARAAHLARLIFNKIFSFGWGAALLVYCVQTLLYLLVCVEFILICEYRSSAGQSLAWSSGSSFFKCLFVCFSLLFCTWFSRNRALGDGVGPMSGQNPFREVELLAADSLRRAAPPVLMPTPGQPLHPGVNVVTHLSGANPLNRDPETAMK